MSSAAPRSAPPAKVKGDGFEPATNPLGAKHRYALLVSYVGTGYQGMQINPGCKTIEADLAKAIHAAGLISDENYEDGDGFAKIGWNRAARTDKGVHAAGGLVSLKMRLKSMATEDAVAAINEHLVPTIRVMAMTRVAKRFNSKLQCEQRVYEYLLPTFLFAEPPSGSMCAASYRLDAFQTGAAAAAARRERWAARAAWTRAQRGETGTAPPATEFVLGRGAGGVMCWVERPIAAPPAATAADAAAAAAAAAVAPPLSSSPAAPWAQWTRGSLDDSSVSCYAHRTNAGAVARLRAALATFVGTRNYHNMTVRHAANDPRVMRYVMSFTCSEPFVLKNDSIPNGCEFVRLNVLGQSFIIYQIRKMIGAAILVASGRAPLAAMASISQHLKLRVPTAPPTGLFLDTCVFTGYNKRTLAAGSKTNSACGTLDFDGSDAAVRTRREAFKVDAIIGSITTNMAAERPFVKWARMMQLGAAARPRALSAAALAHRKGGGKGKGKGDAFAEDWHLLTLGKAHTFHGAYWASVVGRSKSLRLHEGGRKRRSNMHKSHIANLKSGAAKPRHKGPKRVHSGGEKKGGKRKGSSDFHKAHHDKVNAKKARNGGEWRGVRLTGRGGKAKGKRKR